VWQPAAVAPPATLQVDQGKCHWFVSVQHKAQTPQHYFTAESDELALVKDVKAAIGSDKDGLEVVSAYTACRISTFEFFPFAMDILKKKAVVDDQISNNAIKKVNEAERIRRVAMERFSTISLMRASTTTRKLMRLNLLPPLLMLLGIMFVVIAVFLATCGAIKIDLDVVPSVMSMCMKIIYCPVAAVTDVVLKTSLKC
jgi:hypothetical protein